MDKVQQSMIVGEAKLYASDAHYKVNQKYGNYLPYEYHLNMVAMVADKFITLIPEADRALVRAACYMHDVLEDCHVSYNDIAKKFGEPVADIVYAVTNEKGKTRAERANVKYYKGIRDTKYATFVKLCDRIANVLYSGMFGSSQFDMYLKEFENFHKELYVEGEYEAMWDDLEDFLHTKVFDFRPLN